MSDGTQRKLAAIVSADVVGYSRLMGGDEAGTLAVAELERQELVFRIQDPYADYAFKHALVRDAIYDTLLASQKGESRGRRCLGAGLCRPSGGNR